MSKLNDNELLSVWNESKNKVDNSKNDFFEKKFLKLTCFMEIKKSKIINTRLLNDIKYISFVYKIIEENSIYSFVIFNMDEDLPPEKSRIEKYCLFTSDKLDIIDNIIEYKMNNIVNMLNIAIDKKFDSLFNIHFKTMKCKLDKKQLIDVLIKPSVPHKVPSISNIVESIDENIILEEEKENKIEKIFKNTNLNKINTIFDNEKSKIIEKSKLNEILNNQEVIIQPKNTNFSEMFEKIEIEFPKEEIEIMD